MSQQTSLPFCLVAKVKVEGPPDESSASSGHAPEAVASSASTAPSAKTDTDPATEASDKKRRMSDDKSMYNKFNYRISKNPELKVHYQKLCKAKNQEQIAAFVQEVANIRGKIPQDYIQTFRSFEDSLNSLAVEGWQPWKKAADDYGEDVLLEMVNSGKVAAKINPDLPPDSKVSYPRNQVVLITAESTVKKKKTMEKKSLHEFQESTPDSHEAFLKEKALQAAAAKTSWTKQDKAVSGSSALSSHSSVS